MKSKFLMSLIFIFFISSSVFAAQSIILYATSNCGYCTKARALMNQLNLSYEVCDVEQDVNCYHDFKSLGGEAVPLIVSGKRIIHGFNPDAIKRLAR